VGVVALPVSQTVGAWVLCRWTPSLPRRVEGTWAMVGFASHVYGRFTVNYFARNLDNVLVGWRFNAQALGFYKKAYDLFALSAGQLTSPLTTVAVAALSRLNRDPAQYRRYFLNALGVTAFVGMGVGGDLTLVGKDVIRALLGPQWGEAGRIFTFFGPGIGMMLLYGTHGWIHLSIGRADRWFRWGIFEFVFTAGLFVLGLRWGPVGIAVAWTVSFWVLCFPALWYAGKPIKLSLAPILRDTGKYIVASFAAALGCLAFFHVVPLLAESPRGPGAVYRMVVTSLAFAILYLAAVIGLHRGIAPLNQVAGLLREMLPARLPKLTQEVISTP